MPVSLFHASADLRRHSIISIIWVLVLDVADKHHSSIIVALEVTSGQFHQVLGRSLFQGHNVLFCYISRRLVGAPTVLLVQAFNSNVDRCNSQYVIEALAPALWQCIYPHLHDPWLTSLATRIPANDNANVFETLMSERLADLELDMLCHIISAVDGLRITVA